MRVLIVLCSLFTLFSVEAQKKIVLSGIVVNAESEALVGANVALYNATDSTLITGKASDAKGAFKIDCKLINRCYLQISFLGYKTQRLGLVNVYENQEFGKIILETNEVMTDEVQIIASQQVQELDRMIVYPDRIQVKQSATPLDLLANMMLPGLDVNTVERTATALDKAVEFRINGRKVNVKDVDALTASNIQKVEYIDNPGLEYGKGAGAVVNYITKEPITGFSTSGSLLNAVWVGFGNDFLNMRWNHKRSEIGVSYNTMFRKYKKRSNDQTNRYFFPDQTEILREYMGENTPFKSQEHNLNISYSLMKEKDYLLKFPTP
ncbi:carboxypeptidase-like regulatory domain-containing protein [Parabacteroides distasonis]|uniref:carboxypeptidase-like regulatory domain-containing protein n=1 Tax=Parabacteroides distasonis TaxID=823 RepID=UPI001C3E615B|nr:carboxypeptidase-like regulatory domain-containing protein [Parabacteroides distasonis]MCR1853660.1 TonB-dependent receptor [Parabacteroides distasonis]